MLAAASVWGGVEPNRLLLTYAYTVCRTQASAASWWAGSLIGAAVLAEAAGPGPMSAWIGLHLADDRLAAGAAWAAVLFVGSLACDRLAVVCLPRSL